MPSSLAIDASAAAPESSAMAKLRMGLAELGATPAALLRAAETAAAVRTLTSDADLALAATIKVATAGDTASLEQLKSSASAPVLRLARELSGLGDFGFARQWSESQGLDARQSELLRKMLLASVGDPRMVLARLAEQVVRLRHLDELGAPERHRVALETREIFAPLANRLGVWNIKWELEDLTFRELEPTVYRRIAAALNEKRVDRELYIERVCRELTAELAGAGITAQVYGRPKHLYSIHRKMLRKAVTIDQVFDLRAVRILVATIADCYAALGVVHGRWPFIAGEFDDYIATPKENGYRSIHTAVTGPDSRSLEIQIRTHEMQDLAELGVAAHWMYKEGAARNAGYERKIRWVRQVLEPDPAGSADFLDSASARLFDDRIYALTPRGDVVDLPRNATPVDFAYHVHTTLGHRCRGAKVNGRIVPLTHALQSGDVVEIIAAKTAAPSRDWLAPEQGYLVSARSRSKLKAWFRQQDGVGAAAGSTVDAAAAAVPPRPPAPRRVRAVPRHASASPVILEGVGDLPITLARCCSPAPPQPIAGYMTLARGVTVHSQDCPSLARMRGPHGERVLRAEWTGLQAGMGADWTRMVLTSV